jgi:hypothetical protein
MNDEYKWEPHHMQELGVSAGYKLEQTVIEGFTRTVGYLKKGARKRPGWFVHAYFLADHAARLPHTMPLDQAQNAAKLILLSLKDRP